MIDRVVLLDLGTTRLKGWRVEGGEVTAALSERAPELRSEGDRVESDAAGYLLAAVRLLERLIVSDGRESLLGLAVQRSSFLVWEAETARPLTPLISWQDTRAQDWIAQRRSGSRFGRESEEWLRSVTGLLLSPHYFAPKLRTVLDENPDLEERLVSGTARVGTLDTAFLNHIAGGEVFVTGSSVAGRTLLADLKSGEWNGRLREWFGLERIPLARILPDAGEIVRLREGLSCGAIVGDQAAAYLALWDVDEPPVLVNIGTGAFTLAPLRNAEIGKEISREGTVLRGSRDRYLRSLVRWKRNGGEERLLMQEGTVNGTGNRLEEFRVVEEAWPERDPAPDGFCIPDRGMIGAPWWCPAPVDPFQGEYKEADRPRLIREGIVFRLAEQIEEIAENAETIFLSGGGIADPLIPSGLAALFPEKTFRLLDDPEATLRGLARIVQISRGGPRLSAPKWREVEGAGAEWLREKYGRWKEMRTSV